MEIENTNSCIVSGPAPETVQAKKPEKTETKGGRAKKLRLPPLPSLRSVFRFKKGLWKPVGAKKFLTAAAGAAVFASGLCALGAFCTVGVDYYSGGRLLCTVAAADDSAAIIGAAARKAVRLGVEEPDIQVSPKLALKKDLVDGDEAIDKILSASPELCRACVVCVDGEELFAAADMAAVETVLDEYIGKYGKNEDARLSANVEVKDSIIRRDEITPDEKLLSALEADDALTVISAVDEVRYSTIAYETVEEKDDSLYVGDREVITAGVDGRAATTMESVYSDGELLSASIIGTETVAEPVNEVVRVGTKPRNALVDGLSYPLPVQCRVTSGVGPRWGRQHRGVDLAVDSGTNVTAAAAGTVITAKYNSSYGNYVQIDHGYGIVTTYAHLSAIGVEVGQSVERGAFLGYSGSTGNSTGPHLHFELIDNGTYLDPLEHLV